MAKYDRNSPRLPLVWRGPGRVSASDPTPEYHLRRAALALSRIERPLDERESVVAYGVIAELRRILLLTDDQQVLFRSDSDQPTMTKEN